MDKNKKDILDEVRRRDGMTVPQGYFSDFAARMAESLPHTPYEDKDSTETVLRKRTTWQRVRPYVYMAAMFAGVWLMLKMFTTLTPSADTVPAVVAEAASDPAFAFDHIDRNVSHSDLLDDMMQQGIDFESIDIDEFCSDDYSTTDQL